MDLGAALIDLRQLLGDGAAMPDAATLDRAAALIDALHPMAEAEVARTLVARRLLPTLAPRLYAGDAAGRLEVLEHAVRFYPRGALANVVRRLVRDPVNRVKFAARVVLWRERFADVALPDHRYRPDSGGGPYPLGDHNASGWSAGLLRNARMSSRYSNSERLVERPENQALAADRARLPRLETSEQLAALLGVDGDQIRRFLRPGAGPGSAYVEFEVPKRRGGTRTLAAPRAALKAIQRRVLEVILAPLPAHPACHSYVRGRSLLTNTEPHRGAALVVKTDLRDFFPSINERRVMGLLFHLGYDNEVCGLLARLTTYRRVDASGDAIVPGVLPQGAPTSPHLANLICRQLDARLAGLARRCGGRYTRYADDLTFSFDAEPSAGVGRLLWWIDQICAQEGFAERADKRRVLRPHQRQLVTGLVVNDGQRVPRRARRNFRALLHQLETNGVDEQGRGAAELRAHVLGFASWLRMVDGERDRALIARARALYRSDAG